MIAVLYSRNGEVAMENEKFKVRCVDAKKNSYYTVGNVYEIVDGKITDDKGREMQALEKINTFEEWRDWSSAKWELVTENPTFDWDGFRAAKLAVHCDTEDKAKLFFIELINQGIKWCNDKELTESKWKDVKENTHYGFYDKNATGICYRKFNDMPHIKIDYHHNFREVKRPAEVGEWIKVIYATGHEKNEYKIGDIVKVVKVDKADVKFGGCGLWETLTICDKYVVLEKIPQEPIQEEPNKVDWSKVTNKEIAEELLRRYTEVR